MHRKMNWRAVGLSDILLELCTVAGRARASTPTIVSLLSLGKRERERAAEHGEPVTGRGELVEEHGEPAPVAARGPVRRPSHVVHRR